MKDKIFKDTVKQDRYLEKQGLSTKLIISIQINRAYHIYLETHSLSYPFWETQLVIYISKETTFYIYFVRPNMLFIY